MAGYVLDGIETAMEVTYHEVGGGSGKYAHNVVCLCGWSKYIGSIRAKTPALYDVDRAAPSLRFHYMNCPAARSPHTQEED